MGLIDPKNKQRTLIIRRHSGTHLIKPIFKTLVGGVYSPKHADYQDATIVGKVVVVTRDPRNQIVSALRYKHLIQEHTKSKDIDLRIVDAIMEPKREGLLSHFDQLGWWADQWLTPGHHVMRFEDVCSEMIALQTMEEAFDFWGVTVDRSTALMRYHEIYGQGPTFTGKHSNWRKYFGPNARKAWKERNGNALVERFGYDS
jgi:hypothetical protein